jgi:Nif-specific regulatory protein
MARKVPVIGDYTIVKQLERSNYAVVSEILDAKGRHRVLKIARENCRECNELIAREFQILSQFRHPNIISVHDFDRLLDGRTYFTQDFIEGKPLDQYFDQLTDELIIALSQVIHGLAAFHNQGFIHGDLKPAHILYSPQQKQAVLIDFGFAQARINAQSITEDTRLTGTLGYVAPEVIKGTSIDGRSDVYSLGVVVYEILTGQHVTSPYMSIKGISDELNSIIARSVSREPAIRPSVLEIYEAFSKYASSTQLTKPQYHVTLPETAYIEPGETFETIERTRGRTLIVLGDAGVGKTRLLRELKYRQLTKNDKVFYYIAGEKTDLFTSLSAFACLQRSEDIDKENKFQLFEEIIQALIAQAAHQSISILIDNLHNLAEYDLALFRYLGYGIENKNIIVTATSLPDMRVKKLGFSTLSLTPLTLEQTEQLIDRTFFTLHMVSSARQKGQSEQALHKQHFAKWLHQQSGGNPLFVVEILKAIHQQKIILYHIEAWQIHIDKLDSITLPKNMRELLTAKLQGVTSDQEQILNLLAVAEQPVEPRIIEKARGAPIDISIEQLKTLGLIREDVVANRRLISAVNTIITDILMSNIPKKIKSQYYSNLIHAIEAAAPNDDDYIDLLAELSAKASEHKKAYTYHRKAGEHAESLYDYDRAARHYVEALKYEKKNKSNTYPETAIKIADLLHMSCDYKTAIEYYNEALNAQYKDLEFIIHFGIGRSYSSMGLHQESLSSFDRALRIAKKQKPLERLKVLNRYAYVLMNLKRFKKAKEVLKQAHSLLSDADDKNIIAETMYYSSAYEWFAENYAAGIKNAQQLLDFAQKNSLVKSCAYGANMLASLYRQVSDFKLEEKYLGMAFSAFQDLRLVNSLASVMNNQASSYVWQGRISKAITLFKKVLTISQQTNDQTTRYTALSNLAILYGDTGKLDDAIEYDKAALAVKPDDPKLRFHLSMLYYTKGHTDQALATIKSNRTDGQHPLYSLAVAFINHKQGKIKECIRSLDYALAHSTHSNDIHFRTELFLKGAVLSYELGNFAQSLDCADRLARFAHKMSREYAIAQALLKLNNCRLQKNKTCDIDEEIQLLKSRNYILDYVVLKRFDLELIFVENAAQLPVKELIDQINDIALICESIGAHWELVSINKLREKLYPVIVKDYSQRMISAEYLDTFSHLAKLISMHLGDENFLQNTVDLIIQATGAERGALFIKTKNADMEFAVGRNIDHTTIQDAGQLSLTAIRTITKDNIIFIQDASSDPSFSVKKSVMVNQIRSLLCMPLLIANNVIGALYLDSRIEKGMFGAQDKDFLLTVARILASVIEKSLAFKTLTEENIMLKSNMIQEIGSGYLIGVSMAMKHIYRLIENVAPTNSPVVLLGETGTGKGMLARILHLKSLRRNAKFLTINCGTIPETLLESELFGHKRGSFTGAINDKQGLLEAAEGGTVFLDEITNTSLAFQAKLLEAIEEKTIRRIGETITHTIDVRFLFATNRNLEIEVEEGRFRKDLFYRINVFKIEVPPLRERIDDIPMLAQFFLNRHARDINKKIAGFTSEAIERMRQYYWPGNVRELQNVIERAVVLAKRDRITSEDCGFKSTKPEIILPMEEIKKEAIIEALTATGWNVRKAAELLQISRKNIYDCLKRYHIERHPD